MFHPEASRVAQLASGGRHGLAQSLFQLGGNAGSAIGPLIAAFFVLQHGQSSVAWLSVLAVIGFIVLSWVGTWYISHRRQHAARPAPSRALPIARNKAIWALAILILLTATKNVYMASISSYFTFYVIDKFHLDVRDAQLMLFLFLGSVAVGTIMGGPVGDRLGARFVIWFSILGVIPFALMMPYANLFWTCVLTVVIGLVFASAFPAIVVFAQELIPGRVGLIGGIFFGFAFGAGDLVRPFSAISPIRMGFPSSTRSALICRCSVCSRSFCRAYRGIDGRGGALPPRRMSYRALFPSCVASTQLGGRSDRSIRVPAAGVRLQSSGMTAWRSLTYTGVHRNSVVWPLSAESQVEISLPF